MKLQKNIEFVKSTCYKYEASWQLTISLQIVQSVAAGEGIEVQVADDNNRL
jgi:hypothetical protein